MTPGRELRLDEREDVGDEPAGHGHALDLAAPLARDHRAMRRRGPAGRLEQGRGDLLDRLLAIDGASARRVGVVVDDLVHRRQLLLHARRTVASGCRRRAERAREPSMSHTPGRLRRLDALVVDVAAGRQIQRPDRRRISSSSGDVDESARSRPPALSSTSSSASACAACAGSRRGSRPRRRPADRGGRGSSGPSGRRARARPDP